MLFWIAGAMIVFGLLLYAYATQPEAALTPEPVADVSIEEVPAQVVKGNIADARLGEHVTLGAVRITPLRVIEDSRCPQDVQCIQAGTVSVEVQVEGGLGTSTATMLVNTPITTEAETVTLVEVTPLPEAGTATEDSSYRFTFRVEPRTP